METFSIFAALLCAVFALYFILFLGRAIVSPILPHLKLTPDRRINRQLKQKQELLAKVDQAIEAEQFEPAYDMLCQALILDKRIRGKDILSSIGTHHLLILNKTLLIADLTGKTLSNLPVLEDLLSTRIQLIKVLIELEGKKSGDTTTRTDTPSWAKKAFQQKEAEINTKLETNLQSIYSQFNGVKEILFKDHKEEYHFH